MEFYRYPFAGMGTSCLLQFYAQDPFSAEAAAIAAFGEFERIEARYSRYRPESLLSSINEAARKGKDIAVDEETAELLDNAFFWNELSAGLFDISSGILSRAWRFDSGELPRPKVLHALLSRVGMEKIVWEKPRLIFKVPGMEIDFGGMAKEYAADRIADSLRASGIAHGLVDLGGDIAVVGPHPDRSPWKIGIQDPDREGAAVAEVMLSAGGIATSGDYRRSMVVDGKRYGHILNPFTGYPAQGLSSISVVANKCFIAGSIATIAMLKGVAGKEWLRDQGLPHFWVDGEGGSGGDISFCNRSAEGNLPPYNFKKGDKE